MTTTIPAALNSVFKYLSVHENWTYFNTQAGFGAWIFKYSICIALYIPVCSKVIKIQIIVLRWLHASLQSI